jgi:1-acyl-sn-glycerol-3-phosphate acyltransferase
MRRLLAFMQPWYWLTSPQFYGIENVPNDDQPRMLVGNHTMYGILDSPFLVSELYRARGVCLRAMGDHVHFKIPMWGKVLASYGVLPGTRDNCAAALDAGECVLVFPGGAREVAKRKGERYQLTWKERIGFARMAIAHGATMLPMSAIGIDDAFDIWLDADDIAGGPAGPILDRLGVRRDAILPISRKMRIERLYFKFAPPISTDEFRGRAEDDDACWELRERVAQAIERGVSELLELRENDPDRRFGDRLFGGLRRR